MGFIKRLFGMESCNEMFQYPFFMRRKQKIKALEGMLELMKERKNKTKCDICHRKFTKEMTRWSEDDLTSSICIVCNQKFWNKKCKDYMPHEQRELRKLKKEEIKNDKK